LTGTAPALTRRRCRIQRAIQLKKTYNIRIINISWTQVSEPYILDQLSAVEQAWKAGIVS